MAAPDFAWFPMYPERWLLSRQVRLMTYEQRGLYFELLCIEWRDGAIPADTDDLAILVGIDAAKMEAAWPKVGRMFVAAGNDRPGQLVNEWLETIRDEQDAKKDKAAAKATRAAQTRWGGGKDQPDATDAPPAPVQLELIGTEPKGAKVRKDPAKGTPFAQASETVGAAHLALNWPAPTRGELLKWLKPEHPIQILAGIYGPVKAAAMFVHAYNTWPKTHRPTWSAILGQHNQISEQVDATNGVTRSPDTRTVSREDQIMADLLGGDGPEVIDLAA